MPSLFSEEDIRHYALKMSVKEFEKNYLEAKLNRIKEEFIRVYGSMKDKLSAEQTNKLVEGFCKQMVRNVFANFLRKNCNKGSIRCFSLHL